jgi:hypothetical protein
VYICYFDESGDSGPKNKYMPWFVLNCLAVHESNWLNVLNSLVALRRELYVSYGIPPRAELKGAHFRNGKGTFSGLGHSRLKRMDIYGFILNHESTLPVRTFSVAVDKVRAQERGWDPRYSAWTIAFHRLDRMCRKEGDWCSVYPDEGHGFFIRKRVRSTRRLHSVPRHYAPGNFPLPVERILEDPNDRRSGDSYFIQVADLNAYASHRSAYVCPIRKVPPGLWDSLKTDAGDARHLPVNELQSPYNRPPGIVRSPPPGANP